MRVYLYLLFVVIFSSFVSAVPVINSHSGSLVDDGTISISGTGFGTGPNLFLWDDFESGILNGRLDESGIYDYLIYKNYSLASEGDHSITGAPFYSDYNSYAGSQSMRRHIVLRDDWHTPYVHNLHTENVYITLMQHHHVIGSNASGSVFKLWRVTSGAADPYTGRPALKHTINNGGWSILLMQPSYLTSHFVQPTIASEPADNWNRVEIQFKLSNPVNTPTGLGKYWLNGKLIGDISDEYTKMFSEDLIIETFLLPAELANANDDYRLEVQVDNLYISTGASAAARIELCDISTWTDASNKHCEIQIPTSWDGSGDIVFEVNTGSFTQQEIENGLYLYIIDANGIASSGYLISGNDPFVSSVNMPSGLVQGMDASIQGSNFGIKNNPEPLFYDFFNDGSANTELSSTGKWSISSDNVGLKRPIFNNQNTRTGDGLDALFTYPGVSEGTIQRDIILKQGLNIGRGEKVFLSAWFKSNFPGPDQPTSKQWKILRLSDGPYNTDTYPELMMVWNRNGYYSWLSDADGDQISPCSVYPHQIRYFSPPNINDWTHVNFETKIESSVGACDGEVHYNIGGQRDSILGAGQLADAGDTGFDELWIGEYVQENTNEYNAWFDDIYIDNTWQRIEICDNSDYNAASHCELQLPHTQWNDNNIEFEINLGTFSTSDDLWLFVINEDGIASEGYALNPPQRIFYEDFEDSDWVDAFRGGHDGVVGLSSSNPRSGYSSLRGNLMASRGTDPLIGVIADGNPSWESDFGGLFSNTDDEVFVRYWMRFDESDWSGIHQVTGLPVQDFIGKFAYITDDQDGTRTLWFNHGGETTPPDVFLLVPNGDSNNDFNSGWTAVNWPVEPGKTSLKLDTPPIDIDGQWHKIEMYFNYVDDYMLYWADDVLATNSMVPDGRIPLHPNFHFRGIQFFHSTSITNQNSVDTVPGEYAGGWQIDDLEAWDGIPPDVTLVPPVEPVCGNGVIEAGEQCDGSALSGQSCTSRGYISGTLNCSASCTFDESSCIAGCTEDVDCNDGISCTSQVCNAGICEISNLDNSLCPIDNGCGSVQCTVNGCVYSDCPVGAPLLYLKFEDNTQDSSIYDRSISGAISFADSLSGFGRAGVFDGTNYLNAGSWDINGNQITISSWVKFVQPNPSGTRIISKASGVNGPEHLWMLGELSNGWRSRINGQTLVGSPNTLNNNVWYHVATVYDGSSWTIYVNGEVYLTGSNSGNIQQDSNIPVLVGANVNSDGVSYNYGMLNGYLDELLVFDTALSEAQINDLMNNGFSSTPVVSSGYDLDNSGTVGVGDLYVLVSYFGSFNSVVDFVPDGKINILDLIVVVNHFGETGVSVCVPDTEVCDGFDNDCDDLVDEGCPVCGNSVCEAGEDFNSCSQDCDAPVLGVPSITGLTGSLVHDSVMTLSGSNFGVKSPVAPFIYENFEDGIVNDPINSPGINVYAANGGNIPVYSNEITSRGVGNIFSKQGYSGTSAMNVNRAFSPGETFYVSGWFYGTNDFESYSFKFLQANDGNWGNPEIRSGGSCDGWWRSEMYSCTGNSVAGASSISSPFTATWNRWEWTADLDLDSTHFMVSKNNLVESDQTGDVYDDVNCGIGGIELSSFYGRDSTGTLCPANPSSSWYWDEVYVDNTRARVELCNASTKSSASHCEIQIPQNTWNNNNIEFKVNLGSFTQADIDSGLYLFVINENGEASTGKLYTAPVLGAPSITGISGTLADSSMTISVDNAGVKSPVVPVVWDDFESGNFQSQVSTPVIGADWLLLDNPAIYDTSDSFSGTKSAYVLYDDSSRGGLSALLPEISSHVFSSANFKWVHTNAGDYFNNRKFMRFTGWDPGWYEGNTYFHGDPYIYVGEDRYAGGGDFSPDYTMDLGYYKKGDIFRTIASSSNLEDGNWHSIKMYGIASTPDFSDGMVGFIIDGVKSESSNVQTISSTGYNMGYGAFSIGGYLENSACDAYGLDVNNFPACLSPGGEDDNYDLWIDNVYVDNTLQRIELCDSSNYGSASHCEIQIPTAGWDGSGSITFDVNLGSFTQAEVDSGLYLFVINENGEASNGYLI